MILHSTGRGITIVVLAILLGTSSLVAKGFIGFALSTFTPTSLRINAQTSNSVTITDCMIFARGAGLDVSLRPEFDSLTMNVLSTKPANDDGYALMMAVPQSQNSATDTLPKRFTVVLDRSDSMSADYRLHRAKQAAQYCLQNLGSEDVFNVLTFDDVVEKCFTEHRTATSSNIDQALIFINNTHAQWH
jgi:Ca-activated chloride channel family protein